MKIREKIADVVAGGAIGELREAYSMLRHEMDAMDWYSLSGDPRDVDVDLSKRQMMLKLCYLFWRKAPLAGAITRMMAHFTFGKGLPTPRCDDPEAQKIINQVWKATDNQRVLFSHLAQELANNKLWYEGELFIVHFFGPDGFARLRLLNAHEIEDVISDPDDRNTPLYYRRRAYSRKYSFSSHTWDVRSDTGKRQYFADIGLERWLEDEKNKQKARESGLLYEGVQDGVIRHVKINCDTNDSRGWPPLYRSLDWVKAHKEMAQDTATLVKAIARWAWKVKVKGGAGAVSAAKGRLHTDIDDFLNPAPAAGSVRVENLSSELKPIQTPTGGASIHIQGLRAMVLQVAAASGLMEHYFGDPSTGNLATATSMELPMVKMFEANQELWRSIYLGILSECLTRAGMAKGDEEELPEITIEFPPILSREVAAYIHAVVEAGTMGYVPYEIAAEQCMRTLGVKDIEAAMEKLMGEGEPAEEKTLTESQRKRAVKIIAALRAMERELDTV